MCCGTHVTSLSQLQTIKLLYAEKSKKKNRTLLYFLVGNRVISRLDQCLKREQKLTTLLKYVIKVCKNFA
jgi:misacylated tRNA(Ala) deacylase